MQVQLRQSHEARYVVVDAAVRYDEDDMPTDAPMRKGNVWTATIDLRTHKIMDWPQGKKLSFYMKVCDEGTYELLDGDLNHLTKIEGYVPNRLLPGDFGDYLGLDIDEMGVITNWLPDADLSDFEDRQ